MRKMVLLVIFLATSQRIECMRKYRLPQNLMRTQPTLYTKLLLRTMTHHSKPEDWLARETREKELEHNELRKKRRMSLAKTTYHATCTLLVTRMAAEEPSCLVCLCINAPLLCYELDAFEIVNEDYQRVKSELSRLYQIKKERDIEVDATAKKE